MNNYSIAVHGGAGTILKGQLTEMQEKEYRDGLLAALQKGTAVLEQGGNALDAVEAAVITLEDNPLFNAGRGAVFTHDKKQEMDAAIMSGIDLSAGSVTGISNVKNPVKLARAVMEYSGHVLLAADGAEEFARKMGLEFMPDDYFFSQYRYDQLMAIIDTDQMELDHSDDKIIVPKKFGTVGAVAMDMLGNLAASTSTGGLTNKRYGRVGDTPIIGAGTYANNNTCAISCTGIGEYFMRSLTAYDISCLMEYKGLTLAEACNEVVMHKLVKLGGEGGLIAVDHFGNIELSFNSEGMYRGMKRSGEDYWVGIYAE